MIALAVRAAFSKLRAFAASSGWGFGAHWIWGLDLASPLGGEKHDKVHKRPSSQLRVCGAMSPVELRSIMRFLCSKDIWVTNEMMQSQSSGWTCRVHSWQGTSPFSLHGHPSSPQRHFLGDASSPISGCNHHQIVDMLSTLSNGIFPCRKNVLKMPTPPQCGKGLWPMMQTLRE